MKMFWQKTPKETNKNSVPSIGKMLLMGQSFWYLLTLIIYLVCTLLGFGIAYLISKFLVEMNIK
ncbi:MAG: hypothetical protein BWY19_00341 [bacterium ADurb.Bin212]|jgi:hypothetical protein|nr:MAG: hypothetical protein BWY19_00341 [bacterium ADurb.Bin212]